jgi:hypothetical protein
MQWSFSFANFDQVAAGGLDRNIVRQGWDRSRSGMLLRIVEELRALQWMERAGPGPKVSETNLRPDLDDIGRRLRNLSERHRHAAHAFSQEVERHAGFQVMYLARGHRRNEPGAAVRRDRRGRARVDG